MCWRVCVAISWRTFFHWRFSYIIDIDVFECLRFSHDNFRRFASSCVGFNTTWNLIFIYEYSIWSQLSVGIYSWFFWFYWKFSYILANSVWFWCWLKVLILRSLLVGRGNRKRIVLLYKVLLMEYFPEWKTLEYFLETIARALFLKFMMYYIRYGCVSFLLSYFLLTFTHHFQSPSHIGKSICFTNGKLLKDGVISL